MLQGKLKNLWQSRRKEFLLCIVVFLLILISVGINMKNISRKTRRTVRGTAEPRKELLLKQEELQKAVDYEQELSYPIQQLANSKSKFWITQSTNIQFEFRRKIEQSARSSNIRLKTIGTVENVKVIEGLNSYEIAVTADLKIDELTAFVASIEQEQPKIFWKNVRVTPDNIRAPNYLIFSGTLRILVLNAPEMVERLWGAE